MRRLTLAVCLLLAARGAWAQSAVPATALVFREVRLSAPTFAPQELQGTVLATDGDALALLPDGGRSPARVPLAAVERVRLLERPGHSLAWGVVGALAGAAAGYKYFAWRARAGDEPGLAGVLLGVPSGLLIGGLLGAEAGRARWREVRIQRPGGR